MYEQVDSKSQLAKMRMRNKTIREQHVITSAPSGFNSIANDDREATHAKSSSRVLRKCKPQTVSNNST